MSKLDNCAGFTSSVAISKVKAPKFLKLMLFPDNMLSLMYSESALNTKWN